VKSRARRTGAFYIMKRLFSFFFLGGKEAGGVREGLDTRAALRGGIRATKRREMDAFWRKIRAFSGGCATPRGAWDDIDQHLQLSRTSERPLRRAPL